MRNRWFVTAGLVCLAAGMAGARQEASSSAGDTATVLVTLEAKRGKTVPPLEAGDLQVTEERKKQQVTGLTPVGDTPMQLLLLIDDSARFSFGTEINTIKQFIESLPPTTQIGVAYMHNGLAAYVAQFTANHAAAASSVRLAYGPGGADVSPYDSLSDAIKRWQPAPDIQRREVVMITSGIEALGGGLAPENPYVNASIADAQWAGIPVYGIYNPSVGHFSHTLWRETYGQNLLSQMCEETGGESYIQTFGSPVDFGPYFREILDSMRQQYRLTFTTERAKKKPELTPLRVKVAEKDADVAAPTAVLLQP